MKLEALSPDADAPAEKSPRVPAATRPASPDAPSDGAGVDAAVMRAIRGNLMCEIDAMARHLLSGGGALDAQTLAVLQKIEAGQAPEIAELSEAHANLSVLIAPATPRAIRSLSEDRHARGWRVIFGPSPPIRRLTLANFLFALLFFGLSLSSHINEETVALSIYQQSGLDLMMKLLFLMAAAGLGASFGALFEIWQEVNEGRFDPLTESAHWMRIGLGLVAGLVLSEVVKTDPSAGSLGDRTMIAEPLLAMVGGFSAGVLHLVVTRLVSAIESTFRPSESGRRRGSTPVQTITARPQAAPERQAQGERAPAADGESKKPAS